MTGVRLYVHMLGRFSISVGDAQIDETMNRSKKVWTLLACLLCSHGRIVSQQELTELLWSDNKDGVNPANALKTTLHRARTLLDQLMPGGGHTLIHSKSGGYSWNTQIPLQIDAEEFEDRCRPAAHPAGPEAQLERYLQALDLYQGPFLDKLSSEIWVMHRSAYYQNLYIETVNRTLELMETRGLCAQAEDVCWSVLKLEPYQEGVYQHLMRNLLAQGKQAQAAQVYEEMNKLLLSTFGVMPDQESRRLYREALRTENRQMVPAGVIQEQLRESDPITGALVCDYDFFKMIYQAEARMVARSGNAVHIALLSVSGFMGKTLSQRSMDLAMDHLEEQARISLRKGDVISRCSPSQIVIMLPQANYENSCLVCQRILRAFSRQYPHSQAAIQYMVYPLEPATPIP